MTLSARHPAPWISPVCHMKTNGCVRGREEAGLWQAAPDFRMESTI